MKKERIKRPMLPKTRTQAETLAEMVEGILAMPLLPAIHKKILLVHVLLC